MGLIEELVLFSGRPLHKSAERYKIEASYVLVRRVTNLRQPHELQKRKSAQLMYL